eukprot:scaffold3726_cov270-Pinguiococcus_pyrenoidosus.AAC.2
MSQASARVARKAREFLAILSQPRTGEWSASFRGRFRLPRKLPSGEVRHSAIEKNVGRQESRLSGPERPRA